MKTVCFAFGCHLTRKK